MSLPTRAWVEETIAERRAVAGQLRDGRDIDPEFYDDLAKGTDQVAAILRYALDAAGWINKHARQPNSCALGGPGYPLTEDPTLTCTCGRDALKARQPWGEES